jgi:hypothetical protein
MPFINAEMGDDYEDKAVAEGEYPLRITKAEEKDSKAGNPGVNVIIAIEGEDGEGSAPVFQWLNLPYDGCEWNRLYMRDLKRFFTMFGVTYEVDGFNTDDLLGATCDALLKQEDDDFGLRNTLVLPKVSE